MLGGLWKGFTVLSLFLILSLNACVKERVPDSSPSGQSTSHLRASFLIQRSVPEFRSGSVVSARLSPGDKAVLQQRLAQKQHMMRSGVAQAYSVCRSLAIKNDQIISALEFDPSLHISLINETKNTYVLRILGESVEVKKAAPEPAIAAMPNSSRLRERSFTVVRMQLFCLAPQVENMVLDHIVKGKGLPEDLIDLVDTYFDSARHQVIGDDVYYLGVPILLHDGTTLYSGVVVE